MGNGSNTIPGHVLVQGTAEKLDEIGPVEQDREEKDRHLLQAA